MPAAALSKVSCCLNIGGDAPRRPPAAVRRRRRRPGGCAPPRGGHTRWRPGLRPPTAATRTCFTPAATTPPTACGTSGAASGRPRGGTAAPTARACAASRPARTPPTSPPRGLTTTACACGTCEPPPAPCWRRRCGAAPPQPPGAAPAAGGAVFAQGRPWRLSLRTKERENQLCLPLPHAGFDAPLPPPLFQMPSLLPAVTPALPRPFRSQHPAPQLLPMCRSAAELTTTLPPAAPHPPPRSWRPAAACGAPSGTPPDPASC
jgi:hypothetical protein